jgi:hypothetical protein
MTTNKTKVNVILNRYNEDYLWINNLTNPPDTNKNDIKVYLYNKGNDEDVSRYNKNNLIYRCLYNKGREAITYLYHIMKYYDEMVEEYKNGINSINIFSQVIPDNYTCERICNTAYKVEDSDIEKGRVFPLSELKLVCDLKGKPHHICDLPIKEFIMSLYKLSEQFNKIFVPKDYNDNIITLSQYVDLQYPVINFNANSQFIVSTETILQQKKQYYYQVYCLLWNKTIIDEAYDPNNTTPEDVNLFYYCIERLWGLVFNIGVK